MLNDLICFDVIIIYAQKYMFKNAETHTHTHVYYNFVFYRYAECTLISFFFYDLCMVCVLLSSNTPKYYIYRNSFGWDLSRTCLTRCDN